MYSWREYPPDVIPEGYELQIEAQILPSEAEALDGPARGRRIVQLRWQGNSLSVQMEIGETVGHINAVLTRILNEPGQGGEFEVQGEELDNNNNTFTWSGP
jgi:hypothetical protein